MLDSRGQERRDGDRNKRRYRVRLGREGYAGWGVEEDEQLGAEGVKCSVLGSEREEAGRQTSASPALVSRAKDVTQVPVWLGGSDTGP